MADKLDPAAMFSQALSDWERTTNALANRLMGSGEFSRGVNSATNLSLVLQQHLQENMARFLATANLPSREDVAELGATVRAVDARLERIEALLAGLGGASGTAAAAGTPARARPPRTRKPPQSESGAF